MMRTFCFAITVLILVCFFSATVDWLAHPLPAAAMAVPAENAPVEEAREAQSLDGSAPAIQVSVTVVLVLFAILAMAPLVEKKESW